MLAGLYVERTGDHETAAELWPHIEAALAWIDGPGDRDRDGFVEYFRQSDKGLVNQGWKDSHDAIFPRRRRIGGRPDRARRGAGLTSSAPSSSPRAWRGASGNTAQADALDAQAKELAQRFDEAFWCPEIETYALALDGDKRPCRVRTSNAGQVLFSGIALARARASLSPPG